MIVGAIGYACASGLGHLNKWFFEHGVVDSVFVVKHPEYASHMDWFPGAPSTPLRRPNLQSVREWARDCCIDVLLCYETPFFWSLLPELRAAGIKTALVPMHEWHPARPSFAFDLYLCPSALDYDLFNAMFQDSTTAVEQVTIPVDPSTWRKRTKVQRFLHNAGHVGHREHKGTRQLLEAMRYVTQPIDLTVRGQGRELERIMGDFSRESKTVSAGCLRIEINNFGYDDLFPDRFDAYVAPEKLNGLSLPLQEARAAGMLVVTTDRYPTNTWLPKEPLIPVERYERAKVCTQCIEVDEAIVNPRDIARTLDAWHGADIEAYSESGLEWAQANSWDIWAPKYRKLLEGLL